MGDATAPVRHRRQLLTRFVFVLTHPGYARSAQRVTGTAPGWEERTITRVLTGAGLEGRWRVAEHFAGHGAFRREAVEQRTRRLVGAGVSPRSGGYRVVAVDDTECHRTSKRAWAACAFHEPAGRSPSRASAARGRNWVVAGGPVPGTPRTCLPHASRLYSRETRPPAGGAFATETAPAAAVLRQSGADTPAPAPAVLGGACANESVIGPRLGPAAGRRIDAVTRLRSDARLDRPPGPNAGRGRGRPRKRGGRLPAPEDHDRWDARWPAGEAHLYGRRRKSRAEELACRWSVTGPTEPVRAFAVEVEGYGEAWFLVTTSAALTAAEAVAVFAARFRQEDGFRDHEQRLGMEECRARTKAPVEPAFAVRVVARTLLRLLPRRPGADPAAGRWWPPPPWNRHKSDPPPLGARRVVWASRPESSNFLRGLDGVRKCDAAPRGHEGPAARNRRGSWKPLTRSC
jgi:hypothetical protein